MMSTDVSQLGVAFFPCFSHNVLGIPSIQHAIVNVTMLKSLQTTARKVELENIETVVGAVYHVDLLKRTTYIQSMQCPRVRNSCEGSFFFNL